MRVRPTINGVEYEFELEPRRTLAEVLREDCGLASVGQECTDGTCGACTVLVDGEPTRSCLMLAVQCHGAEVRTLDAVDSQRSPRRTPA